MGKIKGKDTISAYLTRGEHVLLSSLSTHHGLNHSELLVLGLRVLESMSETEQKKHIAQHLAERG